MSGKISIGLNIILLIAIIYLFSQLSAKQDKIVETAEVVKEVDSLKIYPSIAWVNNDSLTAGYSFIDDKSVELEKLNDEINAVTKQIAKSEKRYVKLMEKLQTHQYQGNIYTTEEAFNKDVTEVGFIEENAPSMQTRLQTKYQVLAEKQAEINDTLARRVDRFLKSYSSDKPIDLILLYTQGLTGLYASDALDLTEEILNGLNSEYEEEKQK